MRKLKYLILAVELYLLLLHVMITFRSHSMQKIATPVFQKQLPL